MQVWQDFKSWAGSPIQGWSPSTVVIIVGLIMVAIVFWSRVITTIEHASDFIE